MIRLTRKRIILGAIAVLVLAALVYSFLPKPIPVQAAVVRRGPMQVLVEEEGRTEVADRYAITAPVPAFVRRVQLEAGDRVEVGQPVAQLEPPRTPARDPGNRAEAAARVRAAEATAARAIAERERTERLAGAGAATPQALERAITEAERATAELEAARAALRGMGADEPLPVEAVLRSPVSGQVLSVGRRSAGQVNAGDTLVVVGDANLLEVHTDVLSQDAVRIRPGTRTLLEQWGGDVALEAVVRRVEPQGFTSISSLGVEEQRVTVVAAIQSPPELWATRLGGGYRVLSRFVIWESQDVLQVPSSALFRVGDAWAAFVVEEGRAVRRSVGIGREAGLVTEVTSGLEEDDVVIVHPGNEIEPGIRVRAQDEEAPANGSPSRIAVGAPFRLMHGAGSADT
jgi:HlyD family secretion protein